MRCDHEDWIIVGQDRDQCGASVCAANHLRVFIKEENLRMKAVLLTNIPQCVSKTYIYGSTIQSSRHNGSDIYMTYFNIKHLCMLSTRHYLCFV